MTIWGTNGFMWLLHRPGWNIMVPHFCKDNRCWHAVQHQLSNTHMQLQCVCLYQISENFLAKKKSGKKCNFICNIKKNRIYSEKLRQAPLSEGGYKQAQEQSDGMLVFFSRFVLETVALSALDTSNESAQNLKLSRSKKWFVRLPLSGLPREVSETHDGQTRDEGAENKNNKLGSPAWQTRMPNPLKEHVAVCHRCKVTLSSAQWVI